MILTDDNFATIVRAVELGRGLYDNLTKYIRFQMGVLFGLVFTFLGAAIGNIVGGDAFVPLQTLWLNFTTQVFQAVGLGYGEPARGLMQRRPRDPDAQILPRSRLLWLALVGAVMGAATLGVLAWADDHYTRDVARTMGMTSFSIANLFYIVLRARRADVGLQPRRPARPEVPHVLESLGARNHPRAAAEPAQRDPPDHAAHVASVVDLHRCGSGNRGADGDPEARAPAQGGGRTSAACRRAGAHGRLLTRPRPSGARQRAARD
jgi:hypothetical protein